MSSAPLDQQILELRERTFLLQQQELELLKTIDAELQAKNDELEREQAQLRASLSTLESERSRLCDALAVMKNKNTELEKENALLRHDRQDFELQVVNLAQERKSLRAALKHLQDNRHSIQENAKDELTFDDGKKHETEKDESTGRPPKKRKMKQQRELPVIKPKTEELLGSLFFIERERKQSLGLVTAVLDDGEVLDITWLSPNIRLGVCILDITKVERLHRSELARTPVCFLGHPELCLQVRVESGQRHDPRSSTKKCEAWRCRPGLQLRGRCRRVNISQVVSERECKWKCQISGESRG